MAGHPSGWDGRSTPPRDGGRRRSDQRRLLVELELDDSLYQGSLRAAAEQDALWRSQGGAPGRGLQYMTDPNHDRQYQQRYAGHEVAVVAPRARPQSAASRDRPRAASRQSRDYQMQQLPARRLLSPYKLKQQVLGSRHEQAAAAPHHHRQTQHSVSVSSVQRAVRSSSVHQSPAQLVIDAIRQNICLRDQVVEHLQQELLAALPLHRVSHMEKGVPHQIVKLLNKVRSLSLAVVETVVYLQSEFGDSGASGDHQVLEREFYDYLLQMASSDLDFLAFSPHLQLFFEDSEVSLARNPFVDGLSLDSSEVLLCSCHQSSTSTALFCSASSSSSSLFRLLTHKLEAFSLQTQRCLPGWQILPVERVAAALLHLVDLETRFNAVQLLPRYLQPPTALSESRHLRQQLRTPDQTPSMYGVFPDEQAQWAPTSQSQTAYNYVVDQDREDSTVVEAWTNSPISKNPVQTVVPPLSPWNSVSKNHDQSRNVGVSDGSGESSGRKDGVAQLPSPLSSSPKRMLEVCTQPTQDAAMTDPGLTNGGKDGAIQPDPVLSSTLPIAARKVSGRSSLAEIPDGDDLGLTTCGASIPSTSLSHDMVAERKATGRNSPVGRSASRKKSKGSADHAAPDASVVLGSQISGASTQAAHATKSMTRHLASEEKDKEVIRASGNEATGGIILEIKPPRTTISHADLSGELDAIGRHTTTASAHSPLIEHDDLKPRRSISGSFATPEDWMPPSDIAPDIPSDGSIAGGLSAPCEPTHEASAGYHDSMASPHTEAMADSSSECDDASDDEAVENVDDEYDCDFEYSSNEALSSIAQALELLPRVSLGSIMPTGDSEYYKAEEDIQPPESDIKASAGSSPASETGAPSSVGASESAREISAGQKPYSTENTGAALMGDIASDNSIIEGTSDMHPVEDCAFAYSSSDAVSSIALALSLLPQVSRDGPLFISEVQPEVQPPGSSEDDQLKTDSIHCTAADEMLYEFTRPPDLADIDVPNAAVCSPSREANPTPVNAKESSDDDGVSSGLDKIFALCRDVKVAAYDMNHWISQREAEDHFQAASQPYESLGTYQTPPPTTAEAPRYLERELKMLRRNFAYWRVACADQKRAKLVVRRSVARRKINEFLRHRFQLRLQARETYEKRIQSLAASRIQRNWVIYRQKQDVAHRKAGFRVAHMTFQRVRFFVSITRRRRRRETAKELVVRWWRRHRSRLKRQKQQLEKVARERERRSRASKEVQRFLKEVVLRRRLKAAQEMTRNVQFKENLKWTKAKRDVEASMKLNAKHRRELIADMNAKLADLDHKWKTAEQEKLQLLSHHERVLQQQRHIFERKRRALAALKIQMFLNVCLLHGKLQGAEKEKQRCEQQLRRTTLAKELLGVEAQQRVGKLRTQARVLERKLGRVSQQASQADAHHRQVLQALEARERAIQERAARQTIKAFVDFRVLGRRVKSEQRRRLMEQKRLFAEKREQELMSEQDQMEQRRVAISITNDLTQRLAELEEQSHVLVAAKTQLMLEKQQEAEQAAVNLEERRIASSKQQVTSWISEQIRLSRVKREKEEIRASAATTMAEGKRLQQHELQQKAREIASIKVSGFVKQCAGQRRSRRRAEMAQQQQQEQTARDRTRAQSAQTQLVQIIIEAKLLSEREASCGVEQAIDGVLRLQADLKRWRTGKQQRERMMREQLRKAKEASARLILKHWRLWRQSRRDLEEEERSQRAQQEEKERLRQAQQASSLKIQRNWQVSQQRRRMERERVQHEQRMSALKIQTHWLEWQRRQELAKERTRLEQEVSSLKIQRNWGLSRHRRKVERERERIRHQQHVSALKIQRNWDKWRSSRHEELERERFESERKADVQQTQDPEAAAQQQRDEAERLQKEQLKRQEKLDALKYRFCGRCIARTWKTFHHSQRQEKAAVVIEAIWRGKLCRQQYLLALEAKRMEDARIYLLKVSVFATKVQVCWRQWHRGVRQIRRAAVKAMELQLIEEEKAVERRKLMAKRTLAAGKIHSLLRGYVTRKRSREQVPFTEPSAESTQPQLEDWILAGVERTVSDWSHRELPYIVTRSVNHLFLCHDAAKVLQSCVRSHQRRQRLHFHVPRSLIASSMSESGENGGESFHFYFQSASAWLEWREEKTASATSLQTDIARPSLPLRLRFDAQLTHKLLLILDHQDSYSASDFQQILLEITADALPIFQSPVCFKSNSNPTRELRYLEVEELELPQFTEWIRKMERHPSQTERESLPSSSSSSPLESQRTKPSLSIFDAVENASVTDAMLLQQRGVDLGALEPMTNRNALHLLAVSTESYRFRSEMLEFLLHCDAALDVNAADSHGDTPLLLLATHGHLEFMQKLLKHGADLHQTNSKGQNVLHRACEEDHVEICALLQQLMADASAEAVEGLEERETIRSLHTPDVAGRYPLHILAERGFLECAKQVLVVSDARDSAWNAALQAQGDAQGRTPLHLAVLAHDAAMAAFLLLPGGGADPNAFDDLHRAALHFAVESPAALPLISRLVQNGADLNVADERGDTPLHWVAFSGRAAVALHLLALGADPTLVNSDWETPAQISAAYGQLDCMRLLLQAQRRRDASAAGEQTEATQPRATQQPEEKTALERLEDAVTHLHQQQASARSYRVSTPSATANNGDNEDAVALSEQSRGGAALPRRAAKTERLPGLGASSKT
ncbi:hypothetical protein BBJ28_00001204 [Nothophytophthora sp. Chile5]|nr:hypothetical protein BBJ28_00001204 [Nothophytophthora sp. Chile5]